MILRRIIEDDENFNISCASIGRGETKNLPSLAQFLSQKEKRRFIDKLFAGEAEMLDKLLTMLENVNNWSEANRILHEYLAQIGINPYLDEAAQLSDRIYKRYYPKD